MRILFRSIVVAFPFLTFFACGTSTTEQTFDTTQLNRASQEEVEKVIEDFIMAEDSSTIEIPAGFYELNTQLILDNKSHIKIKGAGMDQRFFRSEI